MNSPAENILQSFFDTSNINEVSATQLEELAGNYPYYGTAQLLLAKKLLTQSEESAKSSLQKASLYVSNSLWLNYILNEEALQPADIEAENFSAKTNNAFNSFDKTSPIETDEVIDSDDEAIDGDFTEDAIFSNKLSSLLQEQAAILDKPVEPAEEAPVENIPYHRVDYFESQGIKLDEEKANDKLGTQLKRFTDWLKQMKRINAETLSTKPDDAGEQQVENIAASSNQPKEIVTEAMAEVLIRQGKLDQAIQIYEKLSFNNPSKSAYFAAKIQDLKS